MKLRTTVITLAITIFCIQSSEIPFAKAGFRVGNLLGKGVGISLFAGSLGGIQSPDGTGTSIRFKDPNAVAIDSSGNMFVTESYGHIIRKITPAGVSSIFAGMPGYGGYVSGTRNQARFWNPFAIAIDSGNNLYVLDNGCAVRKITPAGVVSIYAGEFEGCGYQDGAAASALFDYMGGIAVDASDNVYVFAGYALRKITPGGTVSTLAGSNGSGDDGQDGTGGSATFASSKAGIAVDPSGNILVADRSAIRKVTPAGVVTTLAGQQTCLGCHETKRHLDGTGSAARFSDATYISVDSSGNAYVTEPEGGNIRKVTPAGVVTTLAGPLGHQGSTDGNAVDARFHAPNSTVRDSSGNIFVADEFSNVIRKITPAGVVSTFAGVAYTSGGADGTGSAATFNAPKTLTIDPSDNLYVLSACTLRKITPAAVVTTLAGTYNVCASTNGTGSAARFQNTAARIAADGLGNVFVNEGQRIRKVTSGGVVSSFAGSSYGNVDANGASARFSVVMALLVDSSNNLYAVEPTTIRKITQTADVTTLAGLYNAYTNLDGTGSAARFTNLTGGAIDSSGNIFVMSSFGIRKITPAGVVTSPTGFVGQGTYCYCHETQFVVDSSGDAIFADLSKNRIFKLVQSTGVRTVYAGAPDDEQLDATGSAARFKGTYGSAVNSSGDIIMADWTSQTVRKITSAGVVTTLAGTVDQTYQPIASSGSTDGVKTQARFSEPGQIAFDSAGNMFVADTMNSTIRKVTPSGVVTTFAGSPGLVGYDDDTGTDARFDKPAWLAFDASGNLFVSDYGNNNIRKITPAGVVTTFAGTGNYGHNDDPNPLLAEFAWPAGIVFDSAGNLFVADQDNHVIRKITPAGAVTTYAGQVSSAGLTDGPGASAEFYYPNGLAINSSDEIFVVSMGEASIRKITPAAVVSTFAGDRLSGYTNGTGTAARFTWGNGMTFDPSGNLYVADTGNLAIRKITPAGVVSTYIGMAGVLPNTSLGRLPGSIQDPYGLTYHRKTLYYTSGDAVLMSDVPR